MSLSHEDVQEILLLLDDTEYDELTLETDRFTLSLVRSDDNSGWVQETETRGKREEARLASIEASEEQSEPEATEEGLLDIRAPMVGTFYSSPKPGAEPFVTVNSQVLPNTVIAIVEVMKLMNSIPASISGEIMEIHAVDAQFVEKGQLLMRVRPSE
jgi:acetyl-CoA carboxylase biotin carboxyl carrier protein